MVKTLVAIEVDLASSFAVRFACQLGNLIQLEIHPIYVKIPPVEIPMTGVGWVRHTWEQEVVKAGREEIKEVLASESESCPILQEPRVIYGDREIELLHVVEQEPFDLYVEGEPYPFTPATIYKRLHARFYQHLPCPLVWLRGVRKIDRVAVWCADPECAGALVETLGRLFKGSPVPLHLAYPESAEGGFDMRELARKAEADLRSLGCQAVLEGALAPEAAGPLAGFLKESGLVAMALKRGLKKDDPQLAWLAQVTAPLMLVLV
jgi:hypothetical protein